jgi:aspartate-semialdehyde dehydrogenase
MIRVLEERNFPVDRLTLFASARSAGTLLHFRGVDIPVMPLSEESLRNSGAQIALFSAGASVSRTFAPVAAQAGAVVVDNSSAFRMDPAIPLVVPEVNPALLRRHKGIIANPNCSTIQMVVALKPLHDAFGIRRIVVATYQSVTGAGQRGYDQLMAEVGGQTAPIRKFPHRIAFNCIPHIDEFEEDGYTREETKMIRETVKIMGDPGIRVTATCVRVPVTGGHSEAVNIECSRPATVEAARELLMHAPGVVLIDDPARECYPMPADAAGRDEVFVGRVRRDPTVPNGLSLWIVSDNLRKGAATNAVQIAEILVRDGLTGL